MRFIGLIITLFLITGCSSQSSWKRVDPQGEFRGYEWSWEDLSKPVAQHKIGAAETQSFHLVRLLGAEKPHVHDQHDATVTMVSGKARIHYPGKTFEVKRGDSIFIPKGVPHWAENINGKASEAYVVFSPPFDGKDARLVDMEKSNG